MSPQCYSHTWHLPSALETGRTLEKKAATRIPQGEGCSSGVFCEGSVDLRNTWLFLQRQVYSGSAGNCTSGVATMANSMRVCHMARAQERFYRGRNVGRAPANRIHGFSFFVVQSQSRTRFCDSMDCSIQSFGLHCLPEFAQIHVH